MFKSLMFFLRSAASTTATNPKNTNLVVYSVTIGRAGRDVTEQVILGRLVSCLMSMKIVFHIFSAWKGGINYDTGICKAWWR